MIYELRFKNNLSKGYTVFDRFSFMEKKIKDFQDLLAWQEAHKLVVEIYKLTVIFPKHELFSLTNQIRRAVVSITSNIAEGFGRKGYPEKVQFYHIAQGSLVEVKNQLIIARDVDYIDSKTFDRVMLQADEAHKLLQGLLTKTKSFLNHKS
jgi:four helix bundle protein